MVLKMAVFAPIPRDKASTAANVKPGFWRSCRNAYFRSNQMELIMFLIAHFEDATFRTLVTTTVTHNRGSRNDYVQRMRKMALGCCSPESPEGDERCEVRLELKLERKLNLSRGCSSVRSRDFGQRLAKSARVGKRVPGTDRS